MSTPPRPRYDAPRYIAVEGPLRVGKSSLARRLAERLGARLVLDEEDNPHLADFYGGAPGAAFRAQMHFLVKRYCQLSALGPGRPYELVVADYIFDKDKLFAHLNLNEAELAVYDLYYDLLRPQIAPPDLIVYLQASTEVLRHRLERKNLASERQISERYLREVVKDYDHFFFHYSQSDVLVVNTTDIDFVEQDADFQELLRRLAEPVAGTQYYLPLGPVE